MPLIVVFSQNNLFTVGWGPELFILRERAVFVVRGSGGGAEGLPRWDLGGVVKEE